MSYENRLSDDQINALKPGDTVLIERWTHRQEESYYTGTVARTTATQIVVNRLSARGNSCEERYRKRNARIIGAGNSLELVDPIHPRTVEGQARTLRSRRQKNLDSLAHRWSRNHGDLNILRELHAAIGEYLDAETAP